MIEVMDVLISSNRFLKIMDPDGVDLLQKDQYFQRLKTLELIEKQQE